MAKVWEPTETLRPDTGKAATISLQRPRDGEHWQQFQLELGHWFPALKWLIKEFRLHIGYETPDEEAGVRFWLEQIAKRRKSRDLVASEPDAWLWPTADEPVMKATKSEVQQARSWKLEDLERAIAQFFDLRRRLCPKTPILVPLNELRLHSVQTQYSSTPEQIRLHLKEARRASPRSPKLVRGSRRRIQAKALSREVRERLYPRSPAVSKHTMLPDDIFVSRLIDFAILCDGDPQNASIELLRRSDPFGQSEGSRWYEGRPLEELNLVNFWQRLKDKESFGLGSAPGRVANAVQERLSGRYLAERVSDAFIKKFGYETLDLKVLFNFWLTMPLAVRSNCHVRGHSDRQVLESLEEFLRKRKEGKQKAPDKPTTRPRSARKEPWRPAGSPLEDPLGKVTDTLPAPPITPRGQRRGLEVLSRPKGSSEALDFLRALAKRFSKDLILRRMLKQCLAGSLEKTSRSADAGDYDLLLETKVLKRACPDKTPRAAEGLTEGRLKLKDPPGQNEGSFQLWLNADSERAGRFVNLLQTAGQVSQKMEKLMWKRARECHKRGARLCSTGPVVPARSRKEHDIPAFYLVEDTFAQICRKFGAHEAYVRFGPSYLSSTSHANTDVAFLMDRSFHAMELGGAIIDCPTQHAICKASSNEQESYKALEVQNGWHPQIALEEFHAGGSWWEVDLGRLHSCGGVRLQWILPQLKEVKYETRFVLRSDLRLEGGLGLPIKVADVAHGGPAFMAGVQPGDVLQLDAGGDGDEKFLEQPPMVVLTQLQEDAVQQPLRLFFKAPQMEPMGGSLKQKLKVTILASKAGEKLEQVQEQEITVSEKPCVVPAFFVGRQVRLQFGGAWPQMAGKALSVSVGILKVWRLAPPLFRQRFLDIFRKLERKSQKAGKLPPVPRFWSTAVHGQSFNMVINMDIVRKLRKNHDFKGDEQGALLKMAVKDKKEFHVLQTDETMALRQHLFAKDEDVRECTFHPQTAANVPRHVLAERDRISDRMEPEKITSIEDFVKEIGENYDGPKYAKYRHVRRHHMLSQAKSQYFKGALNDALTKLKSSFGVQQILDRFRCHHKGCGKQLDTSQNIKKCDRCSGFYCAQHKSKTVHNCEVMKEQIKAKAKKEAEEVGEGDKSRPPEENFDNKVEFGLLLEARDLAENIITALNKKEKEKVGLEHLGQSLASFGAVRILERPFRKQMCQSALERRRSSSQTATAKGRAPTPTPRLGSRSSSVDVKCKCSKAHSPSELRFPAAESVSRRVAWVKEAINQASKLSDVRPNSAAERSKRKKEEEERKKAPPPPPLPDKGTVKPRARSKPSATVKLEKLLKEKAADLQHAFGLCCEARVKLEANLVADAEQLIQQAKHLAEESLKEALAAAPQQGDAGKEGQAAVRHVEKQELRQMRVSLQQEAQETVELCTMLEEEVQMLRHQLLRPPAPPVPRLPSPPPRPPQWSPPPGSALWPPPSPTVVKALQDDAALMRLLVNACEIPPTTVTGPQKREMCLEFLEAGVCAKEQNCPFAHNPDELHGYEARWSPGEFNSAQHVADIDQMRLQAEQQRQQARLAQQAACAVVSDRSAAAEDDVSLRGLVETSFPATR